MHEIEDCRHPKTLGKWKAAQNLDHLSFVVAETMQGIFHGDDNSETKKPITD